MIEAIPQTDGNTHASGAELSTTPNTLYARWLVSENGMDPSAHIKEVSAWTTVNLSGKPAVFDVPVVRDYTYRTASDMLMRDVEASVSGPIGMADDGRDSLIVISPVHPNPTQPLGIIIRGKNGSHFLGTIDSDNKVTMNRTPSGVIQIGEGARVTVFETLKLFRHEKKTRIRGQVNVSQGSEILSLYATVTAALEEYETNKDTTLQHIAKTLGQAANSVFGWITGKTGEPTSAS